VAPGPRQPYSAAPWAKQKPTLVAAALPEANPDWWPEQEWQAFQDRSKSLKEAHAKAQAEHASPKVLALAVSQAERKVTDLERNIGVAREEVAKVNEKLASLESRHMEAMAQLKEARRKSLQAQCPSADQLPCGPLALLLAAKEKLVAELGVGGASLVAELEAVGARATQAFNEREEAAKVAAEERLAAEQADKERKLREQENLAQQAGEVDLMQLDLDLLDDETLQSVDTDNARPTGDAPGSLDEWRGVQRSGARKAQDLLRNLVGAKRAKHETPSQGAGGGPCG
jgi:hypothetical protein